MERGDTKDKGSGETCQCQREHERRPVDRSAITGHANPSQTETAQKPNSQTIRYWDRFHEFLPATQSVTNVLIMVFTGCLAFLGYVTERPQLAVHPTPLEHFVKGGTPRVIVVFENVGHQAANSVESGIAIAVFPYPLGDIHLTEVPPHGFPIDIFPSGPIGVPAAFQQPLSDADYNAVL